MIRHVIALTTILISLLASTAVASMMTAASSQDAKPGSSIAASVTYTYVNSYYLNPLESSDPPAGSFSSGINKLVGEITTIDGYLQDGFGSIIEQLDTWSFTDGLRTIDNTNGSLSFGASVIEGEIAFWQISAYAYFEESPYTIYSEFQSGYGNDYAVHFIANNPHALDLARTGEGEYGTWVSTSAVPVPAAVWLFATGILGFAGYRRKMNV